MKLSHHFNLSEFTRSESAKRHGISNTPTLEHLENIKILCERVLEPLREHFACPINISSGYRNKTLNYYIGGAVNSQHTEGKAADIDQDDMGGITNREVFDYIKDNLEWDQLIFEHGTHDNPDWVHVSYNAGKNRMQILRALKSKGRTVYAPYEQ